LAKNVLKIFLGLLLGVGAWVLFGPNATLLIISGLLILFMLLWPKIFLRVLIGAVAFIILIWLFIQTSPVQNFIAEKVATKLATDLHTTVKIGHVNFSLFDKMDLDNTLILDRNNDTLLKAGSLKLRITDWFFFKKNIELKYIGLEDAVIKQQRSDSTWNYQFLIDYFSSPDKAKNQSKKIVLKIQKIDLKNIVYIKNDNWEGQRTILKTGSLVVDADNVDVTKGVVLINSIDMDKPYYSIENFNGLDTSHTVRIRKPGTLYFNPSNLRIKILSINIKNGFFASGTRGEIPKAGLFDGKKLEASKINGTIKNFNLIKDTVFATISLNAAERSGFKVKTLQASYKLTPQQMEFSNLFIKTNNSTLTNYFAMQYKDFNTSIKNYVDSIAMKAVIKNSLVYTDDVAYFAPSLSKWNQKFLISGHFNGKVNNFTVKELFARNASNTYASGDLTAKNIANRNKISIALSNANVQTNVREISFIVPALAKVKSPDLVALGNVHFVGDFNTTLSKINAKGTLASALGGMYTDLSMAFPAKAEPVYSGSLQTKQFNLGKFLSIPDIGNVSFNGKVNGSSFNLDKISTKINGSFASLTFKDYDYSNLEFNGEIKHKHFEGDFKANDTNFNFTSKILIDLSGDVPSFNVFGDLVNANLRALKLSKDSVGVTGLFDLNFRGHNIDDFLGYAKILNATVTHNDQTLDFDSLTLTVALDSNNSKRLVLESNEFMATVEGQYNILQLPASFQSFLNHYYPSLINPPKNQLSNQNFSVTVHTEDFEKYAKLIDSNLSGFDDMLVTGKITTVGGNKFNFDINVPAASYKRMSIEAAKISGDGDDDSLLLTGDIGKFHLTDSSYFPNIRNG